MSIQDFKNVSTWEAFQEMTADLKYLESERRFVPSRKGATTVTLDQLYEKMNNLEVTSAADGALAMTVVSNITRIAPNKGPVRQFFDKKIADINQTCSQIQQEEHKVKTAQKKLTTLLNKGTQIGFWLNQSNINKEYKALCAKIQKTSEKIQEKLKIKDKEDKDFEKTLELMDEMSELKGDSYYRELKTFVEKFEEIDGAYNYGPSDEYRDAKRLYLAAKDKLKPLESFKEDELNIRDIKLEDQKNKALASCKIALDSKEYKSFIELKEKPLPLNEKKLKAKAKKAYLQIKEAFDAIVALPHPVKTSEPFSSMKKTLEEKYKALGKSWE